MYESWQLSSCRSSPQTVLAPELASTFAPSSRCPFSDSSACCGFLEALSRSLLVSASASASIHCPAYAVGEASGGALRPPVVGSRAVRRWYDARTSAKLHSSGGRGGSSEASSGPYRSASHATHRRTRHRHSLREPARNCAPAAALHWRQRQQQRGPAQTTAETHPEQQAAVEPELTSGAARSSQHATARVGRRRVARARPRIQARARAAGSDAPKAWPVSTGGDMQPRRVFRRNPPRRA